MVEVLGWSVTIPLMIIIICLIFKKPFSAKIKELRWVRGEGKKYEVTFGVLQEKPQQAIPQAGENVIMQDDVLEAFKKIPDLKEEDIKKHLQAAYGFLLANGIVTKRQLNDFISSNNILDKLETIYIEELLRPKEAPLDPIAIATWGAILFTFGVNKNVEDGIRSNIRQSKEYKDIHG